jgi:hypothetical protein
MVKVDVFMVKRTPLGMRSPWGFVPKDGWPTAKHAKHGAGFCSESLSAQAAIHFKVILRDRIVHNPTVRQLFFED